MPRSEFQSFKAEYVLLPVKSYNISFFIFLGHFYDGWTFQLELNHLSTESFSFQTNPHNFSVFVHPVGLMVARNWITVISYEVKHKILMCHKSLHFRKHGPTNQWGREPSNSGPSDSFGSKFRDEDGGIVNHKTITLTHLF